MIKDNQDHVTFFLNKEIYQKQTIFKAINVITDISYVLVDSNTTQFIIKLYSKEKQSLNDIKKEFNDLLINYKTFEAQSEKNKNIRQTIIKRLLLTNGFNEEK